MTHKFVVRSGSPATGANTEILMDGKPLSGVVSATFSFSALGIPVVNLHMLAEVELETEASVIPDGWYKQ